jgi:glycosyltransferase involved in cell wall biosynthesis
MRSAAAPRVSVLMPVLNPHPVYFPLAVKAVLDQTFTDFELIISEAPGHTSAAPLLLPFGDPRIVHHVVEPGGILIDQRNHGLGLARAEIVALADGDDLCAPDRLAKQLAFLDQNPNVDLVSSQLEVIDEHGVRIGYRHYPLEHDEIVSRMPINNPIAQPGITFRKPVVLAAGGYQYRKYTVNSDYELWSRLAKRGARFAVHPEALVAYRIHHGAIKASKLKDVIAATIDIKRTYWQGELGLAGTARLWAEYGLGLLPNAVVLRLFQRIQFTREPPR